MLGFMIITAFISLWITNTAATVMMLPIVDAVVKQLNKSEESHLIIELPTSIESILSIESVATANLEMNSLAQPTKLM